MFLLIFYDSVDLDKRSLNGAPSPFRQSIDFMRNFNIGKIISVLNAVALAINQVSF